MNGKKANSLGNQNCLEGSSGGKEVNSSEGEEVAKMSYDRRAHRGI